MNKVAKTPLKAKKPRKSIAKSLTSLTVMQDMNDDCLMRVFDYLDIGSLMKMCKLSERFSKIITERVIPLKTIKFSAHRETYSTVKIFKKFGPWMTRIVFDRKDLQIQPHGGTSFAAFVRLVMQYCTPGKLQHLSLAGFSGFSQDEMDLVNSATPYFENVHTINIDYEGMWDPFALVVYIFSKQNLRHLSLHNVQIISEWLTADALPNLQTLHICMQCNNFHNFHHNFHTSNLDRLKAYIASKPALTSFDYYGVNNAEILHNVSVAMPNVSHLGTFRTQIDAPVNDANNNQVRSVRQKWQHLNDFVGLKEFSLQSLAKNFSNCGEIFRILASRNIVKKLELLTAYTWESGNDPVDENHLRQMTNVQTLQLNDFGRAKSDEFLTQLFQNLTGLTKCTLSGCGLKQAPVTSIVQHALKLRVLAIECKVTSFSARFYKRLVRIRKTAFPDGSIEPLIIKIDGATVNECITDLGNRSYKPGIITLKHI